ERDATGVGVCLGVLRVEPGGGDVLLDRRRRLALLQQVPGVDEVGGGVVGVLGDLVLQGGPPGGVVRLPLGRRRSGARLGGAGRGGTRGGGTRLGVAGDRLAGVAPAGRRGQGQGGDEHEGQHSAPG